MGKEYIASLFQLFDESKTWRVGKAYIEFLIHERQGNYAGDDIAQAVKNRYIDEIPGFRDQDKNENCKNNFSDKIKVGQIFHLF